MSNILFTATDINDRLENKLIEPNFGFNVELLKVGASQNIILYMGFLPNDIFTTMKDNFSEEELINLKKIYEKFNAFYITELDIERAIKTRFPSINRTVLPMVKRHIDIIIGIYEKKNNTTIKELFKAAVGDSNQDLLPRFLQRQIFG